MNTVIYVILYTVYRPRGLTTRSWLVPSLMN